MGRAPDGLASQVQEEELAIRIYLAREVERVSLGFETKSLVLIIQLLILEVWTGSVTYLGAHVPLSLVFSQLPLLTCKESPSQHPPI